MSDGQAIILLFMLAMLAGMILIKFISVIEENNDLKMYNKLYISKIRDSELKEQELVFKKRLQKECSYGNSYTYKNT